MTQHAAVGHRVKRTPKQRVLRRCPTAYSKRERDGRWTVRLKRGYPIIGLASNAKDAWADAKYFLERYDQNWKSFR